MGEQATMTAQADLSSARVSSGDTLSVAITAQTAAEGLELLYWGKDHPSSVELGYTYPVTYPPTADAGEDFTAYVGEETTFHGAGNDSDGQVVMYEWDFDGDGTIDYNSTTSGTAGHTYEVTGLFAATLTVVDNDGLYGMDSVNVSVQERPVNDPPWVDISSPSYNETLSGEVLVEGEAGDDVNVTAVEARFDEGNWKTAMGTSRWNITWDTVRVENGPHVIEARSFDGELYSDIFLLEVVVENENEAPGIEELALDPEEVPNDGETPVMLTAEVDDPDGADDVKSVTADLSEVDLDDSTPMNDDGEDGDERAGDGIYTCTFTVDPDVEPGRKRLRVTAEDSRGQEDSGKLNLQVNPSNSPPEVVEIAFKPASVPADGETQVLLEVTVGDPDGLEDIDAVEGDLSALGLGKSEALNDGGRNGDETAGDGVFSMTFTVSDDVAPGTKTVKVTAEDSAGLKGTDTARISVTESGIGDGDDGEGDGGDSGENGNESGPSLDMGPNAPYIIGGFILVCVMAVIAAVTASGRRKRRMERRRRERAGGDGMEAANTAP
jgi:hypothetical protein